MSEKVKLPIGTKVYHILYGWGELVSYGDDNKQSLAFKKLNDFPFMVDFPAGKIYGNIALQISDMKRETLIHYVMDCAYTSQPLITP